jgi:hypothetical protein
MARPDQTLRSKGSNEQGGVKRLFFPEAPFPHGIQLIFKDYSYEEMVQDRKIGSGFVKSVTAGPKEKSLLAIELPMPSSLTDATGVIINSMEREFMETFLSDTLSPILEGGTEGAGGLLKGLFDLGETSVEGIAGALKNFYNDPKATGGKAVQALDDASKGGAKVLSYFMRNTLDTISPGLGKSMGAASGIAMNPNATLAFDGVNLRSFSLDWTLYPDSAEEAESIKQIVRAMKKQMLPEVQSIFGSEQSDIADAVGGATSTILSRAFLKYPSVVYINLLGVDESAFPRFKPVMIDSIDVNYGPSGEVVIAQGGVPQGIKLGISCKEIEIQTAEDFRDE